jgi:hypothetical protein
MNTITTTLASMAVIIMATGCNLTFGRSYTAAYIIESRDDAHPGLNAGSTASAASSQQTAGVSNEGADSQNTDRTIEAAATLTDATGQGINASGNTPAAQGNSQGGDNTNTTTPTTEGVSGLPAIP